MDLTQLARRSGAPLAALSAVLLACEAGSTASETRNDSSAVQWTPARAEVVRGVPIQDILAAIDSFLRASPPASIDADPWRHVRGL
jgi:hypothetical protein